MRKFSLSVVGPNIKVADYPMYRLLISRTGLESYVHIVNKSFLDPPATIAYFFKVLKFIIVSSHNHADNFLYSKIYVT